LLSEGLPAEASVVAATVSFVDWSNITRSWERALTTFIERVGSQLRWMLIGSAATAVHGVTISPGDVDILIHPDTPDTLMCNELEGLDGFAARSVSSGDLATFSSTHDRPLLATADGSWLFGRWTIYGCQVEVARIREPVDAGLLVETVGLAVWDCREVVAWHGQPVPVVPLEVQLATIVSRGLDQRARAVRSRLAEIGYKSELLDRAFIGRSLL
jgi:hypothetical protein